MLSDTHRKRNKKRIKKRRIHYLFYFYRLNLLVPHSKAFVLRFFSRNEVPWLQLCRQADFKMVQLLRVITVFNSVSFGKGKTSIKQFKNLLKQKRKTHKIILIKFFVCDFCLFSQYSLTATNYNLRVFSSCTLCQESKVCFKMSFLLPY